MQLSETVRRRFGGVPPCFIHIGLSRQRLELLLHGRVVVAYAVSTARAGAGEELGSERTPRGWHVVRAKIGAGQPEGAVFVARRPSGQIWSPALRAAEPERDWILSRILWLSGAEPGRNRLGPVDTMRRYIYIHGCPTDVAVGVPGSHGCVRMRNRDVIDLFERVAVGTPVLLAEEGED